MTALEASRVVAVMPGDGKAGYVGDGIGVVFKLWPQDTGGQLSIVEHPFAVGALVPPHLHTREDEFSIVVEGEIGFRSEDDEVVLGPGGYIVKPRNQVHAMWNAGTRPARMIEIISPAGFEGFFDDLLGLQPDEVVDVQRVSEIAAGYGLEFHEPAWLGDVVERYSLSFPPA